MRINLFVPRVCLLGIALYTACDEQQGHSCPQDGRCAWEGGDKRIPIDSPNAHWPERAIGKLGPCTASLVGPRHALTVAHCVSGFMDSNNFHIYKEFFPARSGDSLPFGSYQLRRIFIPKAYLYDDEGWDNPDNSNDWDFALVELAQDVDIPPLRYGPLNDSDIAGKMIYNRGYPLASACGPPDLLERATMWGSQDLMSDNPAHLMPARIYSPTQASGGHSGSPLYIYHNGDPWVVGIHKGPYYGSCNGPLSVAIRIAPLTYHYLVNWQYLTPQRPCCEAHVLFRGDEIAPLGTGEEHFVPADYDGDGKAEIAIYNSLDGIWQMRTPEAPTIGMRAILGGPGWLPVPADYDGDGQAEVSVFYPEQGVWQIQMELQSETQTFQWANPQANDIAAIGDYFGKGDMDFAIFREGLWILEPWRGEIAMKEAIRFGQPGDIPVPGDYNGDGKYDFAIWRPNDNSCIEGSGFHVKYWDREQNVGHIHHCLGSTLSRPVIGDFDGDGTYDFVVVTAKSDYNRLYWEGLDENGEILFTQAWGVEGDAIPGSRLPGHFPLVTADFDGAKGADFVVIKTGGFWNALETLTR